MPDVQAAGRPHAGENALARRGGLSDGSLPAGGTAASTPAYTLVAVDVEEAIRTRRTVKAFEPEPVDRGTLEELLELARWAPNHHLTNPWRFRVLGPEALDALKRAAAELARRGPPGATTATRRRGGGREARPRADPGRLLRRASRRSRPGRGGPPRHRLRRLHRAARRARTRPGGLLAHAGRAEDGRRRAGRRPRGDERFVGLLHLGNARSRPSRPSAPPVETTRRSSTDGPRYPRRGSGITRAEGAAGANAVAARHAPPQALAVRRLLRARADAVCRRRPHRPGPPALVGARHAGREAAHAHHDRPGGVSSTGPGSWRWRATVFASAWRSRSPAASRPHRRRVPATTSGPANRQSSGARLRRDGRQAPRARRPRLHRRERRLPRPPHRLEVVRRQRADERTGAPWRGTWSPASTTRPRTASAQLWVDGEPGPARPGRLRARTLSPGRRSRGGVASLVVHASGAAREADKSNLLLMRSPLPPAVRDVRRGAARRDRACAGVRRDGGSRRSLVGR